MSMKFTLTEWEIIEHRLGCPDAIAECLTDHCEGEQPASNYSYDEIEASATFLLNLGRNICNVATLDLEILKECCEGSTFFCDIDEGVLAGNLTKDKMYRLMYAADVLENKLNVSIPRC